MPRPKGFSLGSLALAALGLAAVLPGFGISQALAQERVDIRFEPGATSTTINGAVRGDEYIDYVLNARGGQAMVVSLAVTGTNGHGSAYFNILPAGKDFGGPYTGSSDDDRRAEITVPHDGDWAIRVYLMGNDRDTDKTVGYSIDVYIAPSGGSSRAPSTTGEALTPGTRGKATGLIDRMDPTGQRMSDCELGVIGRGRGNASAVVTLPTVSARETVIEGGAPLSPSPAARLENARSGDSATELAGDTESFQVVGAVICGG